MLTAIRITITAVLTAALALVGMTPPAAAAGEGNPQILGPTGTVPDGSRGPVVVSFADAPVDDYDVYVWCDNDEYYYEATSVYYDGTNDTFTWTLPTALTGPAPCTVEVEGWEGGYDAATFQVAPPPPPPMDVSNASASYATFYPYVRDGYRDTVAARFRLNQRAQVTVTVRSNATGRIVRRLSAGWMYAGSRKVTWNGRNSKGDLVKTGGYSMQVRVVNSAASADTATVGTKVATATVTRTKRANKWGNNGAPAASSSCYVTRSSYYGTADLDCWGGAFAQMTYTFRVPAGAYNVKAYHWGETSSANICCQGKITHTWWRPNRTTVKLRSRVTGWRAYTVEQVRVVYTVRIRI